MESSLTLYFYPYMNNNTLKQNFRQTILAIFALATAINAANAQTMKQWRDSLNNVNKELKLFPNSTKLLLSKAAVNLQLLEWSDAIEACGQVLAKDKNNLSALYYRAYAYNNLRRYSLAKNDYERFLSMSPDNMEARLGLAYTYMLMDRDAEALDQLNNLIELHPENSVAYAARAELEKDMKMYDTALFDFDEALKRDPTNTDYTVSKVEILILQGRRKEAKKALDTAVSHGVPRGLLIEWYTKCK